MIARGLQALSLFLAAAQSPAYAGQTTTTYTYNPDGALTAVTVAEEGQSPVTTYLTWDNFTPYANDPGKGSVSRGDGNLVTRGSVPGGAPSFGFDVRGRLMSQGQGQALQKYRYHADSILRESELGENTRQMYHAQGSYPQIANIVETNADRTRLSARLGPERYLSDGTTQSLFKPRKDMVGLYDSASGSFEGRGYDPYGLPDTTPADAPAYDLTDPPDGFAGEYTDPSWGGVYLRARWYDPEIAQFVSRDPRPNLNRFAYGGGNPVMNVDPGGTNFFHSLGVFLDRAFHGRGIGGYFASFFLMPIVGPLEIAANPKGFWESIKTDRGGFDVFLALGAITEIASIGFEEFGLSEEIRNISPRRRIWARRAFDHGLGIAQAVAAGEGRGTHHFNWASFGHTLSQSYGTLLWSHWIGGIGYHPFAQRTEDIFDLYKRMAEKNEGGAYVFRESAPIGDFRDMRGGVAISSASPVTEKLKLGFYHEAVVVVSKEGVQFNELINEDIDGVEYGVRAITKGTSEDEVESLLAERGKNARYQAVRHLDWYSPAQMFFLAPRNIIGFGGVEEDSFRYHTFRNNCQHYARAVLQRLIE